MNLPKSAWSQVVSAITTQLNENQKMVSDLESANSKLLSAQTVIADACAANADDIEIERPMEKFVAIRALLGVRARRECERFDSVVAAIALSVKGKW